VRQKTRPPWNRLGSLASADRRSGKPIEPDNFINR
jgi:hypothetical protein